MFDAEPERDGGSDARLLPVDAGDTLGVVAADIVIDGNDDALNDTEAVSTDVVVGDAHAVAVADTLPDVDIEKMDDGVCESVKDAVDVIDHVAVDESV